MNDSQFVVRIAHIITCDKLTAMEQWSLVKLSYARMAFPEKDMPPVYNFLMKKLYGDDFEKWDNE